MIVLGALQRPCPSDENSNATQTTQLEDAKNKSQIIWTSSSSGKTTIVINRMENQELTEVDIMSSGQQMNDCSGANKRKGVPSNPSYVGFLKRGKVIRSLIIVYCGITGSLGMNGCSHTFFKLAPYSEH